jgi:hypothetical protein
VPHLLDRLDLEPERIGQRLLGEPRVIPTRSAPVAASAARTARRIEMVEHRRKHARRIQREASAVDRTPR